MQTNGNYPRLLPKKQIHLPTSSIPTHKKHRSRRIHRIHTRRTKPTHAKSAKLNQKTGKRVLTNNQK